MSEFEKGKIHAVIATTRTAVDEARIAYHAEPTPEGLNALLSAHEAYEAAMNLLPLTRARNPRFL